MNRKKRSHKCLSTPQTFDKDGCFKRGVEDFRAGVSFNDCVYRLVSNRNYGVQKTAWWEKGWMQEKSRKDAETP